ncbi:MAG TPA: FixH family protein [Anaerolineales bacterium]|nr:FixH family protein [Anaerolineales bacterium]HRK87486.1 FixH family protein [Anaerolineales bacterium]
MNSQNKTIVITAVVTAVLILVGFFVLMPILGPRFMHPMMVERMHGGESGTSANDLNTETTRMTNNGAFIVSFKSELDPITIGSMHSWVLHVETADGEPVEGATILVDGGMPDHGHGLPTSPQVTQDMGNGDYLVEGLRFQMGGWWEVKFNISADGVEDNVTFNIILGG